MTVVADILLITSGVIAIVIVLDAVLRTFVLPRGAPVLFTSLTFRSVRGVLRMFARPSRGYEARDRVMALYGPLALITFPGVALVVLFGAFACFFEVTVGDGWREALTASGS